jgi:hypothetical protein
VRAEPAPPLAVRGDGGAMTTDNPSQSDPSGLPVPQDGEQLQDALPGQAPGDELELDAYGIPVQDQSARRFVSRGVAACLVCTVIAAALPIVALRYHSFNSVPRWLVWLDLGVSVLAAWLWAAIFEGAKKRKQRIGVASRSILWAGAIVGLLSGCTMMAILGIPAD